MNDTSLEHPVSHKQNHAVQFPLEDVTILQNPSGNSCSNCFNWNALKTQSTKLKAAQIVSAIVILVLTQLRYMYLSLELPYVLFTYSATSATAVLLIDSVLTGRPLRRAFTPVLWFRMELLFNGIAALVYHLLAYYVIIMSFQLYRADYNIVAGAFGFVSAALHLSDWWSNFSKRHEIIREMASDVDDSRRHEIIQGMGPSIDEQKK